jgi:hypothetical protein
MNTRYLVIVIVVMVILVGTTALSTTDIAFADKKKYEKNQVASQANDCGNGELPLNIGCQNLLSQIQGDGNAANIIGVQ